MKKILFLMLLQCSALCRVCASDFYWVNGSGRWSNYANHWATSSGGVLFHTSIPTLNDNVFFDANSFSNADTVKVDSTFIYCKNFNCSGVNNQLVFESTSNPMTIFNIHIYGSFISAAAVNWGPVNLLLSATGGVQSISSFGNQLYSLKISGPATYNFTDNLNTGSLVIGGTGVVNTNNHNITAPSILIYGDTIDLGNSRIICMNSFVRNGLPNSLIKSSHVCFVGSEIDNNVSSQILELDSVTLTAGEIGGAISCNYLKSDYGLSMGGDTSHIGKAVLSGDVTIYQSILDVDSLIMNCGGKNVDLNYSKITINGGLSSNATCSKFVNITNGTIIKTSGLVILDYALLKNNTVSGGAQFTAANCVDLGGNTGWNILPSFPRSLHWVHGSGNWTDPAHWSLTSGGPGGICPPMYTDSVYFDSNSFSTPDTVNIDVPIAYCKSMNCTGVSNPVIFRSASWNGSTIDLYGSFTSNANITWYILLVIQAPSGVHTITCAAGALYVLELLGNATYNLADDIKASTLRIGGNGVFNSNNHDLELSVFETHSYTINLGYSHLTCTNEWYNTSNFVNSSNVRFKGSTLYASQSIQTLKLDSVLLSSGELYGSVDINYLSSMYDFSMSTDTAYIKKAVLKGNINMYQGFMLFDTLTLLSAGKSVKLNFAHINISGMLIANGTCSQSINLEGGFITKQTGTIAIDYATIHNSSAQGGASFIANNSFDMGGNSGWSILAPTPRILYWVNGSGNWTDTSHWSLSTGGTGGNCAPSSQDDVIYDSNSFTGSDTVVIDLALAYCKSMDCSGISDSATFTTAFWNGSTINLYGSFISGPNITWYVSLLVQAPAGVHTITTGGSKLSYLKLTGNATYNLSDDLLAYSLHISGTGVFNSNDHTIEVSYLNTPSQSDTINLGHSALNCYSWDNHCKYVNSANCTFTGTSIINFQTQLTMQLDSVILNSGELGGSFDLNYLSSKNNFTMGTDTSFIHKAVLIGNIELQNGVLNVDTLIIKSPGQFINLHFAKLKINDDLYVGSMPGFPTQITGGTIIKLSGEICLDYVLLQNSNTSGGALFFAGSNSIDLGGNSGWTYTSCIPSISNVWPGDANNDLICNNFDLLNLGLAYGYSGAMRSGASTAWVAQPSTDWLQQFVNGANLKNADTNGDGVVNQSDTLAITQNYGLSHPLKPIPNTTVNTSAPLLYFDMPPGTMLPGSVFSVPIILGTQGNPISSIYGIAFSIEYDTLMIQPGSVSINYSNSWLTATGNYLHFEKELYASSKMDMVITRTDHQNAFGYGRIANLVFSLSQNASGPLQLSINSIKAVGANELEVPVQAASPISLITGIRDISATNTFEAYPNPFKNEVIVTSSKKAANENLEIFDVYGRSVYSSVFESNNLIIEVANWKSGVYFLRSGSIVKKLIKE